MMPVIRLSDAVFERLQSLAVPLVDNPESVIIKLLDHYEAFPIQRENFAMRRPTAKTGGKPPKSFDPDAPPDLTHTKLLSATFDQAEATNWNELVDVAHRLGMARLKTYDALRAATKSNIAPGKRADSGFHYLADINVSIQGIDSDLAWRNVLHLARKLNLRIRAEFEWRDKPTAAFPGERGLLEWTPSR